jgi:hypothetical protein
MFGTQVQKVRLTFPDEDDAPADDPPDEAEEPDDAAVEEAPDEQPAAASAASAAPAIRAARTWRLVLCELAGAGRAWEKSFIAPPGRDE